MNGSFTVSYVLFPQDLWVTNGLFMVPISNSGVAFRRLTLQKILIWKISCSQHKFKMERHTTPTWHPSDAPDSPLKLIVFVVFIHLDHIHFLDCGTIIHFVSETFVFGGRGQFLSSMAS